MTYYTYTCYIRVDDIFYMRLDGGYAPDRCSITIEAVGIEGIFTIDTIAKVKKDIKMEEVGDSNENI